MAVAVEYDIRRRDLHACREAGEYLVRAVRRSGQVGGQHVCARAIQDRACGNIRGMGQLDEEQDAQRELEETHAGRLYRPAIHLGATSLFRHRVPQKADSLATAAYRASWNPDCNAPTS